MELANEEVFSLSWITDAVIYHIYPLGLCGAPPQNPFDGQIVPRIRQLEAWIPHLQRLGVNCVYFGPVFASCAHGYDTTDYFCIDPRLGSNQDFARLCQSLKNAGIRVILDGVFNHVGRAFWAFRDLRQNRQSSPYKDWFANIRFDGNSPHQDGFSYESWHGFYELVKLNLANEDVVKHLLEAVALWMDQFHIDGLRLDAADCVRPEFFARLRSFCKTRDPDFWLMGEIIHGDYTRWANNAMLDSVTNYECRKGIYSSHNDKNYFEIAHSLTRQFGSSGIYRHLTLYNFVDNHDVDRLASVLRDPHHLFLCYALLFTMPGVPSVYYGSEWGVTGVREPHSDAPLRPCLPLRKPGEPGTRLADFIAKLSVIRRNLPALRHGDFTTVLVTNQQLVFRRAAPEQCVYVALNLAEHPQYVEFPASPGTMLDVFTATSFTSNDGNFKLELPAYGCRIFCPAHDAQTSHLLSLLTQIPPAL